MTVQIESFLDGEPLEDREEGAEIPESNVVLEPGRLVPGLFDGLIGIQPGETREVVAHMPADHENEKVRDKDVVFKVKLVRLQERLLPEWDELPVLEEFEGTLDELRDKTRSELAETLRTTAERDTIDAYIKQLVEQTDFDIPDALIEQEADQLLHQRGHELERYGISLEQMLQYRGQSHDQAVDELKPQAEERLKTTLALREIVLAEGLTAGEDEVDAETEQILGSYEDDQRDRARQLLSTQLRSSVASSVIDKKLRERLFQIATGTAPELGSAPAQTSDEATDAAPAAPAEASEPALTDVAPETAEES